MWVVGGTVLLLLFISAIAHAPSGGADDTTPAGNHYHHHTLNASASSAADTWNILQLRGHFQCSECGHTIAATSDYMPFRHGDDRPPELNTTYYWQSIPVRRYVNPHGYAFQLFTIRGPISAERGMGISPVTPPSVESAWFKGFMWRTAVCSRCGQHIGWTFEQTTGAKGEKPINNPFEPPLVQPPEPTTKVVWLVNPNAFIGGSPQSVTYQFTFGVSGVPLKLTGGVRYELQVWMVGHGSTDTRGRITLNGKSIGVWGGAGTNPAAAAQAGDYNNPLKRAVPVSTSQSHEPNPPLDTFIEAGETRDPHIDVDIRGFTAGGAFGSGAGGGANRKVITQTPDFVLVVSPQQFVDAPGWNSLSLQYTGGSSGVTLYRLKLVAVSEDAATPIVMSTPWDTKGLNRAYYGSNFAALIADRVTLITENASPTAADSTDPLMAQAIADSRAAAQLFATSVFVNGTQPTEV